MALEHAILVSLSEQSASGYELARRFDRSIGFFWQATHQQIYKVLGRMESDKLIVSELVEQHGRPDKKVHVVTAEGRDELARWTREPTPTERLRSDFAVKVRGLGFGDRAAVLQDIARQRDGHRAQLEHYRANAAKNYPDPEAVSETDLPAYLVLRGGIRFEQSQVDWCQELLAALEV